MNSYQLVLATIEKEQDETKLKLQQLQSLKDSEEQKKATLQNYQQDYIEKLDQNTQCYVGHISRYRSFIHQLDELILEQDRKILSIDEACGELIRELAKKQRKAGVLQDLIAKKNHQHSQLIEKQQQLMIDDMTGRQYMDSRIL